MNSSFFNSAQISVFLENVQPSVEIHDREMFLATICAFLAHGGKKDKEGEPYILHPIRVASQLEDKDAKIVALLHDVLEDSSITSDNLKEIGFSNEIVHAVIALTRGLLQSYSAYLKQVSSNQLAKTVKIADIRDNMNPERLKNLDRITQKRLVNKYEEAIRYLSTHE